MQSTETWKPVPEFENHYEVSDLGRLRANRNGRILKGSSHPSGYSQFLLCDGDRRKWWRLHRLVAAVFIGAPEGRLVRHLDDDPQNNALVNLAYGTHSDNLRDALRNNPNVKRGKANVTECPKGHPYDEENTLYTHERDKVHRNCRECGRQRSRARSAAKRAERIADGTYVPPNAEKTHCVRGHEYSPENTQISPKGGRTCRSCRRERDN